MIREFDGRRNRGTEAQIKTIGDAGAVRSVRGNASILSLVIASIPAAHERLTNASGGVRLQPMLLLLPPLLLLFQRDYFTVWPFPADPFAR